jgi:hypothetical protein
VTRRDLPQSQLPAACLQADLLIERNGGGSVVGGPSIRPASARSQFSPQNYFGLGEWLLSGGNPILPPSLWRMRERARAWRRLPAAFSRAPEIKRPRREDRALCIVARPRTVRYAVGASETGQHLLMPHDCESDGRHSAKSQTLGNSSGSSSRLTRLPDVRGGPLRHLLRAFVG